MTEMNFIESVIGIKPIGNCWCGRELEESLPKGRIICDSHIDDFKQPAAPRFTEVCPNDGEPLYGTVDGDGVCYKCHFRGMGVTGKVEHWYMCRCIECRPPLKLTGD